MSEHNNIQNAFQQAEEEQLLNIPAKRILEKTKDIPSDANKLKRRWFWELLQNASDYNEEVHVILELYSDKIIFKHNGLPFSPMDARNLIAPDSGKDNTDLRSEDTIGQFGTGFISTHVLSSIITVEGIVKVNNQYAPFKFDLDRTGYNDKELLKSSLSNASKQLKEEKSLVVYHSNNFNTIFSYDITRPLPGINIDEVINSGLEYVNEVLPYTLAFMPKIKKVTILNHNTKHLKFYKREYTQKTGDKFYVSIVTDVNNCGIHEVETKEFILSSINNTTVIVSVNDKKILPYPNQLTKLFCSLPMIGTENFAFSVVINSLKFNPKTERDGIRLSPVEESNREILIFAVDAYKILISKLIQENYFDFYNLIKWQRHNSDDENERKWYSSTILLPLKEFLLEQKIVISKSGIKIKFDDVKIPYFPNDDKSLKYLNDFYEIASIHNPDYIPQEIDFPHWYNNIDFTVFAQTKYELKDLLSEIHNLNSLENLSRTIAEPILWLNSLISLVLNVDENLLDQYAIIPNQVGNFLFRKDEIFYDQDLEPKLIEIFDAINDKSYKTYLLHKSLEGLISLLPKERIKNESILCKAIDDCFSAFPENERTSSKFHVGLQLIFKWLADCGKDEKELKELFKWFSQKKPQLFLETIPDYDRDKVLSIAQSGKLNSLSKLAESNISKEELNMITANVEGVVHLASILENIPGGLNILIQYAEQLQKDDEDFKFKLEIGEKVEHVLKEALINSGLNTDCTKIDHNGIGSHDFEIRNLINGKQFYIELKSYSKLSIGPLHVAPSQAKFAYSRPLNYCLAAIERPLFIEDVTEDYIKINLKAKTNITEILSKGLADFEKYNQITNDNNLYLNLREAIRLNISKNELNTNGMTFVQLIEKIKTHLQ
ncbi:sacsin N-terminal ATP-binding-like domain-containing protein [Aquirufa lenticrescens]|uniref:sacsin N-terminal ATP-binding-like domain-containing protein n=1 Tax=Aquirufa lenticrescens TaxID=2696560 RepID=UPI001CAA5AC6|nr:hypothetical protein [Aquirufa lenticrescens]UAJ14350.1 hypothetical protein G9X62_07165 [Aquirufa lenticrescens]